MFKFSYTVRLYLISLFFFFGLQTFAQSSFQLKEGRGTKTCVACEAVLKEKPDEVLYGIQLDGDDIIFSTNSIAWFYKLFNQPGMGMTVDLIARSRYSCNTAPPQHDLTNGFVIKPLYRDELLKKADTIGGNVEIKIGKVPVHLRNEILEGNLVIINNGNLCTYWQSVNIDRGSLDLLPMGFYTDTLFQMDMTDHSDTAARILYTVKKTITVPFKKGTAAFQTEDLLLLRKTLGAGNYSVRHLELRAYSSVDGPEEVNRQLMQKRATAVQNAITGIAPGKFAATIIPAENWIEFNRDVLPKLPQLTGLSKKAVKQQLQDKTLLSQIEPILATHRKAVITVWLDNNTRVGDLTNEALVPAFNASVKEKRLADSRRIVKEIAVRIAENRLPDYYIDMLKVPTSIDYDDLLSDLAVYRYNLGQIFETDALETLYDLRKHTPADPYLNYNICVLELNALKYGNFPDISTEKLAITINSLGKLGIHPSLVKRMLLNYQIVLAGQYMRRSQYDEKDQAVEYINEAFETLTLNDQERYSLAKFFTEYGRKDLAMSIILPRVSQLDTSEDIIFYFINLCFFDSTYYESAPFSNAVLNAANINRARFCQFFQPAENGGASIQLLETEILRKYHCDNCPQ
ncbi:hypothetical protein [Chitinophaga pinensis]|uniref:Uncharacterized protein n=1 Tax=Chitinophaga pinensis (strain ATCC 43595 / DSM 2588 / LMG 13176 / NBRC 15968 / NCIMB 11800 / UQM 2034) TaxID=485918 RepID=A0A979GAJ2_CHIPD|nr:hypothetical protein [Chitinophaga pinensis]ACU63758.1 hypothetical protein Cpin_6354 [Chitinophaga pinensis DSM 2588]